MNRILQPTGSEKNKNEVRDNCILNRELLFTRDGKNLYIKYDDELIPIGGECKQNRLEPSDNIEIIRDGKSSFYLTGEQGDIWIENMVDKKLTVSYISTAPLAKCTVSIADGIDVNLICAQKTLPLVAQNVQEEYYKYSTTITHDLFVQGSKFFICVQIRTTDSSTEIIVPQGDISKPDSWKSFKYGTEIIRLMDDIDINTCTLSPDEEGIWPWKGTVKLGELKNHNSIFLFMKRSEMDDNDTRSLLGGEVFIKMTANNNTVRYAHATLTCSSTGSWSLRGAAEAESVVRMIKAQDTAGEYYYGIKLPKILQREIKTIEETYSGYDYQHLQSKSASFRFRVGNSWGAYKDRDHLEIIDENGTYLGRLVDTGIVTGGNIRRHVQYANVTIDRLVPAFTEHGEIPTNSEVLKYLGKEYYLYFDVLYEALANNAGFTVRLLGGYICTISGNYDPTTYPERIVHSFHSENSDVFTWNANLVRSKSWMTIPYNDCTVDFCTVSYQYAPWSDNLKRLVQSEVISEEPFNKAEIWFNGWQRIVPNIPTGYTDDDLKYVVLSDTSHDNDSYAETFYMIAPEVPPKLEVLQDTGEDNAPYRFIISGKVSLTDLESIAALCRDPERQVYLDMSNAYVDSTAEVWANKLFAGCVSLRGLSIPKGVTKIQDLCFIWCTYLRDLNLYPSANTLVEIGAASGWSTSVGLLTSTRVRDLQVPASVNNITKYLVGSSNIRNLIFLHEYNAPLTVEQWSWMIISTKDGNATTDLPENFHLFITKTWNDGFIKSYKQGTSGWTWNNPSGWWTPEVVNSIVVFDPGWDQEAWQTFNDTYQWGEDVINDVRAKLGYPDAIEIKENKVI